MPADSAASPASTNVELPSRRALREQREAEARRLHATPVSAAPVIPVAPAPVEHVAVPFGTFDELPAAETSRRSARRASRRVRAERVADRSTRAATSERPLRRRMGAAGAMLAVGGLFASLAIPAYASASYDGELADAAPAAAGQVLALDAGAAAASEPVAAEARDTYTATSAADLRRLYRDGLRQQNLEAYLASGAKELGDDYPWAAELAMSQGGGLSPLRYYLRQCVDFVAWRLNRDAGSTSAPFKYDWSTLTPGGGSAYSWKSQWERHGWPVSSTPAAGWVAWFPGANHVAYVTGVLDDGSVLIEEYNWGSDSLYGQRIIAASDAVYLSPPPR